MGIKRITNRLDNEILPLRGFVSSLVHQRSAVKEMQDPVDIVVTWVDGNDPKWQADREAYARIDTGKIGDLGNGPCRYRDWSFFRYWFRAIEKYAPWCNKVYFVTYGHVPQWLNLECPKLRIVRHEDFIPQEYLPTFNSIPIELNLHRIPELSEHFVYFNDDMFLARPCEATDFFRGGNPCICPIPFPQTPNVNQVASHIFYATYCEINQNNNFTAAIRERPELWFSYANLHYYPHVKRTLRENIVYGGFFSHMGVPFCKSTMEKAWKKYPGISETCKHKFRTPLDVMHLLFSVENLISGNFSPVKPEHFGTIVDMLDYPRIRRLFEEKTSRMVCFTDSNDYTNEDEKCINQTLNEMFERIFPEKSVFEK